MRSLLSAFPHPFIPFPPQSRQRPTPSPTPSSSPSPLKFGHPPPPPRGRKGEVGGQLPRDPEHRHQDAERLEYERRRIGRKAPAGNDDLYGKLFPFCEFMIFNLFSVSVFDIAFQYICDSKYRPILWSKILIRFLC